MKANLILLSLCFCFSVKAQNVGIGTNSPNSKAILDLTSSTLVFLPPRMTNEQMNNIGSPPLGSLVFNATLQTHMTYARMGFKPGPIFGFYSSNYMWAPVSPGPRVLAWGFIDSSGGNEATTTSAAAPIICGSGNFSVRWQGKPSAKKWYELSLHNDNFDQDSMLLMVTPVGNGSWDVSVTLGEVINGSDANASIKFVDVSRSVAGWSEIDRRRRSRFNFILYDLRGY